MVAKLKLDQMGSRGSMVAKLKLMGIDGMGSRGSMVAKLKLK